MVLAASRSPRSLSTARAATVCNIGAGRGGDKLPRRDRRRFVKGGGAGESAEASLAASG
ncbi:hypothetical protein [Lysobacter gummosus]|uniref:hypothetical protein n=1 Tax=Lysobacter gummosus TaxID=262324 RepID=UPI003635B06E